MKKVIINVIALGIGFSLSAIAATQTNNSNVTTFTNDSIEWKKAPQTLPEGVEIAVFEGNPTSSGPFTLRLKFPANAQIKPHTHPGTEHITVIDGSLDMGLGSKFDSNATKNYPAGSFIMLQPNTQHYATTKDGAVIQLQGQGPWSIKYVE